MANDVSEILRSEVCDDALFRLSLDHDLFIDFNIPYFSIDNARVIYTKKV